MDAHTHTNMTRTPHRGPAIVLAGVTAVCASGIFALTAHGNYGYARDVMHLGTWWALGVPAAFDVLQAAALVVAVVDRGRTGWRWYAWFVFALANVSSVAGNLSDAHAHGLGWEGMAGAAWLPILLSLGVHLTVGAWRRALATTVEPATPPAATATPVVVTATPPTDRLAQRVRVSRTDAHPATPTAVPAPLHIVRPGGDPKPPPAPRTNGHTHGTPEQRAKAAYRAGEHDVAALHTKYAPAVHIGTVRRWVREVRAEQAGTGART